MRKLLPLAVLLAAPAQAQESAVFHASDSWPVLASGRTCTLTRTDSDGAGVLSVSHDGAEITLTTTNELESPLPESGKVRLAIVFLDNRNGNVAYDDGWGSREFAYTGEKGAYRFTTRFAGDKNVRQFLADLASSRVIGLLQGREPVISYELAGVGASVARLRDCAARAVAAN